MSASGSKPYECLICASPIYNTNLGIDACRACTVFYRRHLNSEKKLLCRKGTDDCFEKNTRPLCRKCRYVRFSVVLAQSTSGRLATVLPASKLDPMDPGSDSSEHNSIESPEENGKHDFIDHRSFDLFSSCTRDAPFFDRMKKGYSMLCVVRKCGEMSLVNQDDEEGQIKSDGMIFYPINHAVKMQSIQILNGGLMHFFEAIFDDFSHLSEGSKKYILDKAVRLIHSLDALYRAVHHFEDEDVLAPTYMSYIDLKLIDCFVNQFAESHKTDVVKEMKKNFARSISMIRASYKRVNPSNEEFLAMMGLSLWNNDAARVNDDYMEIVSHNRSIIMSELHKFYISHGIADYSMRLGDVLCLLESIEKNADRTEEDITTFKLLKSINGDMDDMCNMK